MSYIIIAVIVVGCILFATIKNKKPTEEKLEKQKREYEEIMVAIMLRWQEC